MKALAFLLTLCLLLTACARPATTTPERAIVLQPLADIAPAPARTPDSAAAKLVKRDAAALRRQVRRFVASPDAPIEQIKPAGPLVHTVEVALTRMETHHTRRGYRPDDVAKARGAADALAAYLASVGGQN